MTNQHSRRPDDESRYFDTLQQTRRAAAEQCAPRSKPASASFKPQGKRRSFLALLQGPSFVAAMDRYHIFNEIGSGRQSQVFKGRQKKSVQYVAIKRVEKGQMEKVANEVQMMHALNHPHTLKFYDWYETRNNLWLILEYCSGGDLKSLLKEDKQLPVASVKLLGGDLLAGLQYLHYSGLLYCDLKPSNVLIDEHGILKLAGFGLARRIPCPQARRAPKNRGTPYYMAPELFVKDGVHSFASDLWALGCVLYELAAGRPPFASAALRDLMDQVLHGVPTWDGFCEHTDSSFARRRRFEGCVCEPDDFTNALRLLLTKEPLGRPTWPALRDAFWADVVPPPPNSELPPQPLFDAMVAQARSREPSSLPSTPPPPIEQPAESRPTVVVDGTVSEGGDVLRVSRSYHEHLVRTSAKPPQDPCLRHTTISKNQAEDSCRAWWESSRQFADEVPEMLATLVFTSTDGQVRPILGKSTTDLLAAPAWQRHPPRTSQFGKLSVEDLASMSQADLEAHLVVVYKAIVDGRDSVDILDTIGYLESVCPVARVANVVVNSSFVALLLHLLRTRGAHNLALRHRLLVLVGLLMRHATYVVPDPANDTSIAAALKNVLAEDVDVQARQLALAALGELLFYMATQSDSDDDVMSDDDDASSGETKLVSSKRQASANLFDLILSFLGDETDELVLTAVKTVGNVLAHASPVTADTIVTVGLIATLARHAAPALAAADQATCVAELPRAALAALVYLFRSLLGFTTAPTETTIAAVPRRLQAMLAAIEQLGGADVVAEGVVATLAAADDVRWQLVVLNLLNLCLAQRPVSWDAERRPELARHAPVLEDLEHRLTAARENLLGDQRVAAALVRTIGGGGCIASTVRAKAAVALLQLGVLDLPTLASVVVEVSDDHKTSLGLMAALDRLGTRDVHELQHDAYFAAAIFALVAFLADVSRLLAAILAKSVRGRDPHALEAVAFDSVQTALNADLQSLGTFKTTRVLEYLVAQLTVSDVAASFLLVTSAIASPLLRPHVITAELIHDLGAIVHTLADVHDSTRHHLEDLPTYYILYQTLPSLLDALVSRDAHILAPHAHDVLDDANGLLVAACRLVAGSDHDVRLTAAHLLRHTLPALLQGCLEDADEAGTPSSGRARHNGDDVLGQALARMFAGPLPDACVRLLASCEHGNDECLLEAECMLRLLLEAMPRWHVVSTALASNARLAPALAAWTDDHTGDDSTLVVLTRHVRRAVYQPAR